jgi:hypothetical protein
MKTDPDPSQMDRRCAIKSMTAVATGLVSGLTLSQSRAGEGATTNPAAHLPQASVSSQVRPRLSRVQEYSWVRGFNYQPSWGSHGLQIWNDFREAVFIREVELGLKYFPKINVLRIWFSYDAHMAEPKKFLKAAKRATEILAERKLKMIPVVFNGWHSPVDFGGFSSEQLKMSSRLQPAFGPHRQYLCELIEAIRPAGNLLMYDIANEPFNVSSERGPGLVVDFLKAMAQQVRELDSQTPISVGTQGCPGIGGPQDLDSIDPFVDVHAVHPYWIPIARIPAEKHAEDFHAMVEHLKTLGKPVLATECCWGSNDDATRVNYIRHDLGLLKQAGIGFLPHALHHSKVADLHRPVPGRKWETMYMGFIDPDGRIRPGHEVYNEF